MDGKEEKWRMDSFTVNLKRYFLLGNYIQSYSITLVKAIKFILYLNIKSRK